MLTVIVGLAAFLLGVGLSAANTVRQVRSGRLVICGRVYWCKDTGPVVR